MEDAELKKTIETLLFITDQPLPAEKLAAAAGESDVERVRSAIAQIGREAEERGSAVQVIEIAEGWQMSTRPEFAPSVRRLYSDRMTMRLSAAALETLSIISYKQPLTRAEVEEIRGVEVIAALETLLEKDLVRVVGRRESVGRPLLYGTTSAFLRHFGLRSLADLPPLDTFTPPPEPSAQASSSEPSAESSSTVLGTEASENGVADTAESIAGMEPPAGDVIPVQEQDAVPESSVEAEQAASEKEPAH
ncbi:MAG: SMC-Scp complex subunit ScpB [Elusimicrobiota bacterium]|jgi:segregation and condensation protein B